MRRVAAQVDDSIKSISDVAETKIIGGTKRQIRVLFDPLLLHSRNLTVSDLIPKLKQANLQSYSGSLKSFNNETLLQTGQFFSNSEEIGRVVVGVFTGKPVYLKDVATIIDGPEEPKNYVLFGKGDGSPREAAVTISIAKRPGANAVDVVDAVL